MNDTVDGRNPAPVDMVNVPFFTVQGFIHVGWCRISSINSTDTDDLFVYVRLIHPCCDHAMLTC